MNYESAWPAVGSEKLTWHSRLAVSGVAAARQSRPTSEYDAAVPAHIARLDLTLPGDLAAYADDASDALIRFDSEIGAEIAPFASLLLRSEAVASSQIEHLTASARQILTAELGVAAKPNATMIAANTRTMVSALDLADALTVDTVLAMHAVLMEGDTRHPAGEFRREPVWIGRSGLSPAGAEFVAPAFERVPELVEDAMEFARRLDLPRLAQTAVTHAQFETIHPFTDGNGRTGRALMQAMLRGTGLTRNVTVPVSAGLLTDTASYHRALTAYRQGDIRPIIQLSCDASFLAIANARTLVAEVTAIRERWQRLVRVRPGGIMDRVLGIVAQQPVLNAASLSDALGVTVTNVYRYIAELRAAGILIGKSEYKHGIVYRNDEVLGALDAFAARAGRRA